MKKSYADKLRDVRWQRKRLKLLELANWICQECGADDHRSLDVHHSYYKTGLDPWDYPQKAYRVVCTDCHDKRTESEHRLLRSVQSMNCTELAYLSEAFETNRNSFIFPVAVLSLSRNDDALEALFMSFKGNHHVRFVRQYVQEAA
jgi:hypothetical protein